MRSLRRSAWLLVLAGCSRDPATSVAPAPREADAARTPAPSPTTSASPPALTEGTHDYVGTLGDRTRITLHLTRRGQEVLGAYTYTSVGRPIALSGTIDGSGTLALVEKAGATTTGTMHLHAERDGLVGAWANAAGDKTFPVRLSAGPAAAAPTHDGGTSKAAEARACLADVRCPAGDAERLLLSADDAHERDVDCFAFLDGAGTKRDLPRGRACLERSVGKRACEAGSSPGLDGAELALMLIDGAGGPQDLAGGRALVTGCFEDATVRDVLAHAAAKESAPSTPPMAFCKESGGTTLTSNDCLARDVEGEEVRDDLALKDVARSLDEEGRTLLNAATKALRAYAHAVGAYAYEVFAEGTIRVAVSLEAGRALERARAGDMATFRKFVAAETTPRDVTEAEQTLTRALAATPKGTPAETEAFQKAQAAWRVYRDAELALYAHTFASQGVDRVRRAVTVRLATRRVHECAHPSPG